MRLVSMLAVDDRDQRKKHPAPATTTTLGLLRPGIATGAARTRLRLPGPARTEDHRPRGDTASEGVGDSARLAGRVDLRRSPRPPAGHRCRLRRAQAVSLPPPLAGAAGSPEVRPHGQLCQGAAT